MPVLSAFRVRILLRLSSSCPHLQETREVNFGTLETKDHHNNLRFGRAEFPMGDAKPSPIKRAVPEQVKGGGNMNKTMGDLILVVIQSIAIASFAGLAFYCLLTWVT